MKPILSASQMKACDAQTIQQYKVPSLVLMERAALAVCEAVETTYPFAKRIGILCGPGNNGGDGVAIARILHNKGLTVNATVLGDSTKFSTQLNQEIEIAHNYGVSIVTPESFHSSGSILFESLLSDCDILIDALFGIGLTRGLGGEFKTACDYMNNSGKPIIAVDIPSGYDTDSGKLLGEVGVHADLTVTFAYLKKGLVLSDCKANAGEIKVADVGIYCQENPVAQILDESILNEIPKRTVTANKGTCGKVLIIAGSENIYGACFLAARAALVSGSGLVKVFTHKNNIASIQQNLPEAMYISYVAFDDNSKKELQAATAWADSVVIGPGLGTSILSSEILGTLVQNVSCPVVVDADGLNILASDIGLLDTLSEKAPVVLTPHLKEMERLCGTTVSDIDNNMEQVAASFAKEHNCTIVLKNHTEIICNVNTIFYNCSGNEALATPGSGDVLAGIIGALLSENIPVTTAAAAGAFIHGRAGVIASEHTGIKGLLASDIIDYLHELL